MGRVSQVTGILLALTRSTVLKRRPANFDGNARIVAEYQGRFRVGDTSLYGGPTSTPMFDAASGYLYTLCIDGDLKCWNTKKSGQPVWSVNLYEE